MIVEAFLFLGVEFTSWLLTLLPNWTDEAGVIITASNGLASIIAGVASLSVWIPWGHIAYAAGLVFLAYFSMLVLRLARVLMGHVPFVGGNG